MNGVISIVRRLSIAFGLFVTLTIIWGSSVLSRAGQITDTSAMFRAMGWAEPFRAYQRLALSNATFPIVVGMVIAGLAFALIRRDLRTFFAQIIVFAGATFTTQILKYGVFWRPDLGISFKLNNSLPSGHTTSAVAAGLILFMGVPVILRVFALWISLAWGLLVGLSTVSAGWHRPSDVIAAYLVVGIWGVLFVPSKYWRKRGLRDALEPTSVSARLLSIVSWVLIGVSLPALAVFAMLNHLYTESIGVMDAADYLAQLSSAHATMVAFTSLATMALIIGFACRINSMFSGAR